ncbi:RNA methyltransferase [Arsenicitalea aurantiaca]|uniref:tRNA (cytidine/uridine-2'-O-)-methyltransferase TrmJ n=1 Tax=Arsenicitalea aurantiaca TaxID=1783274 RepID=A0A433XGB3_9HYPH|nr:RNA methyltransferase [Arsenicitalea aurantiaca]RUT33100.1 RNA methyltransferase [Arsenicitalea aurantiaca]
MAGTDSSQEIVFRPSPAIILCEPQLGENIGTTARAMANFGLWDLRLVNPRDGWPNERAIAAASRANHVIARVRVFATVEEAIADLTLVYATTARRRDLQKPVLGPDVAAQRLVGHIEGGRGAGLLFGRERWGLYNEEVALSDAIVTLPVEAAFASLNIAQAVLVLAYEWRRQSDLGAALPFTDTLAEPASKAELIGLFNHLEETLDRTGFFTAPDKRPTVVNNLRAMLSRGNFSAQEVRTLRGVISSIDRKHERPDPRRTPRKE